MKFLILALLLTGCGTAQTKATPCPCKNTQACETWDGTRVTSGIYCVEPVFTNGGTGHS